MGKYAYLYNCYITLNDERTNLYFDDFLDEIIPLLPHQRLKSLRKSGDYTSKGMMPDSDKAKERNRKIGFAKYRDRKPYEAEKGTDLAELIKKDVLEMTGAMFIPDKRLAILEYNHYGPRINAICQYLASFLKDTEDEKWGIEFDPVESKLGWDDIAASNDIRSIEIKLDIAGKSRNFISKTNEAESLLAQLIQNTVKTHSEFGANTAKIYFGNGRKKGGIKADQVLSLIELLSLESELFESVRIKYRSPQTKNVEEVDLKNAGVRSLILNNVESSNNWEFICNEISREYYDANQPGNKRYLKQKSLIPVNLPDIIK